MAIYGKNGVEIQKIEGILKNLQEIAKRRFAPLLEQGEVLSVDESSILGRILGIVAEPDALNEELILMLWQSLDIDQAEGEDLDKLLKLVGIYRKMQQQATAGLILRGDLGVTVEQGSSVGSNITGDRFIIDSDIEFTTTRANGVVISVNNLDVGTKYKISFKSSESGNVYPPVSTTVQDGDTEEDVVRRLNQLINTLSTVIKSDIDLDDRLFVQFINANTIGDFTVEGGLEINESFKLANSYSATYSAVRQAQNTLTVIQSPVLGWRDVYNPFDSFASVPVEDDTELRKRAKYTKGADSVGNRQAMYGDLMSLSGVKYVGIKENIYDTEVEGRGAHGVSVFVLGGNEEDIFRVIDSNIGVGTLMDGDIRKTFQDEAGQYELAFSRVELVPIEIKLALTVSQTFELDGYVKIQDALVSYFEDLSVGEDVNWSQLFTPINTVKNQSVNSIKIAVKGQELLTQNVEILPNQLAVLSYEDISI